MSATAGRQKRDYELLKACDQCGNEYTSAEALTAHQAEVHGIYTPALCLTLHSCWGRAGDHYLHVILAADGLLLNVMDETPETLPLWVKALVQLPTVDVTPGVWQRWKRDGEAMRA